MLDVNGSIWSALPLWWISYARKSSLNEAGSVRCASVTTVVLVFDIVEVYNLNMIRLVSYYRTLNKLALRRRFRDSVWLG